MFTKKWTTSKREYGIREERDVKIPMSDSVKLDADPEAKQLRGTVVAFDERIQRVRPHAGQIRSAANLRRMLEGDDSIRDSHRECGRVQHFNRSGHRN